MPDYKCIHSFTGIFGKQYYYGNKISSKEYSIILDADKKNFVEVKEEIGPIRFDNREDDHTNELHG